VPTFRTPVAALLEAIEIFEAVSVPPEVIVIVPLPIFRMFTYPLVERIAVPLLVMLAVLVLVGTILLLQLPATDQDPVLVRHEFWACPAVTPSSRIKARAYAAKRGMQVVRVMRLVEAGVMGFLDDGVFGNGRTAVEERV
jgi:hypothetical protein